MGIWAERVAPDAVRAATGVEPELPSRLAGIMTAVEEFEQLPADREAVESFILARSRAVAEAA